MPAINFPEYARELEQTLYALIAVGEAVVLDIRVDQRSSLRGFISGSLQFSDGSRPHFREFVDVNLSDPRLMYGYHYEMGGKLGFRYDNAAHRLGLSQGRTATK